VGKVDEHCHYLDRKNVRGQKKHDSEAEFKRLPLDALKSLADSVALFADFTFKNLVALLNTISPSTHEV
jgi:hypothetical protein